MPGSIRVGVVDDHPSILAAISAAIAAEPDLTLSGTGRTLEDAVELLSRSDVLLCDVQLEGSDGLRVLDAARLAERPPAVLLISGHAHHSVIRAAVERGAAGYLDKSAEVGGVRGGRVRWRPGGRLRPRASRHTRRVHLAADRQSLGGIPGPSLRVDPDFRSVSKGRCSAGAHRRGRPTGRPHEAPPQRTSNSRRPGPG